MAAITQLFNGLALLVLAVGGGAFFIAISIAAFYYLTAFGEPQKVSIAKSALMASVVGIAIMAFAPFAPRVLNQVVFQPAGSSVIQVDTGGCDGTLRTALLTQRSVNTAARVNLMIKQIQAQRENDCGSDVWNPEVEAPTFTAACNVNDIGGTPLPDELKAVVTARASGTQGGFARAPDGSMVIQFDTGKRPADRSQCWVYIARDNFWDEDEKE